MQELLTRHKPLCAEFLEVNYDKVFTHYQQLLNSENYVTRRQSLKLLGELLLDRHNFTVSFSVGIKNPELLFVAKQLDTTLTYGQYIWTPTQFVA